MDNVLESKLGIWLKNSIRASKTTLEIPVSVCSWGVEPLMFSRGGGLRHHAMSSFDNAQKTESEIQ